MSSRFIQPQSASHSEPIPPREYQTGSQTPNSQYNLNCHPHSQNTPPYMTNGSTLAATPDMIAGSQTSECHYTLYPRSSSPSNAAYCYPFGHQRSIHDQFRSWQQGPLIYGQPCHGCVAVPPEGAASPNTQTLNTQSQMNQHTGHPAHADMTGRSYIKIESQVPPQLEEPQLSPIGQVRYPQDVVEPQGLANIVRTRNTEPVPGPIPAKTPLVVRQDEKGVQWIAFEYAIDKVKMQYTIRCDVESVNTDELSLEFKKQNCVYPRACNPEVTYEGKRLKYETECNRIAWGLAKLNVHLQSKRGLLQRAVDSWRNSSQDPRLRSRRVRRLAKKNTPQNFCGLPDRASPQQS